MGSVTLEEWRDVIGFEGLYEVSSLGQVRSCERDMTLASGRAYRRPGKTLAFNVKKGLLPYRRVKLSKEGRAALLLVSRLVLTAFERAPKSGEQACHCNGNPSDNRLDNLRWDTAAGNHADRQEHGTAPIGNCNGRARLTVEDVRRIRAHKGPLAELAAIYGTSCKYISNIRSKVTWKHVD